MKKLKLLFVFLISVFTFTLTNNVFAEETYDPETRIKELNTEGQTISTTDHDNELRFIGANPNNYVSFNGQKWRIIGVFDGRLKIIEDSIGQYSWDTSKKDVNDGNGVNQWGPSGTYTGADLMKLLNPGYESNTDLKCNATYSASVCGTSSSSDYIEGLVNNSLWWNGQSGYCYYLADCETTTCDFTTTGLQSDTARNMIDNATWYLGSDKAVHDAWAATTASYTYNFERGNLNGKQCTSGTCCTDTVDRTTTWQGKVGLLYPSDYIYATSGGTTYDRSTCLTVHVGDANGTINNWYNTYTDCKNNNWLSNEKKWTLTPYAYFIDSDDVLVVGTNEYCNSAKLAVNVRPVVYLKSSIQFTGGDGSIDKPFELKDISKEETNTISNKKQVVKTGNTGISQSSLLIIIGSIMVVAGSILIIRKRKNN